MHNDSSATKHLNQNLHPITCTLTFHRNLQRQKCRQANKQTKEANKPIQIKGANKNKQTKQTKQTTRNQNKPIKGGQSTQSHHTWSCSGSLSRASVHRVLSISKTKKNIYTNNKKGACNLCRISKGSDWPLCRSATAGRGVSARAA
jgi:hypothetical protein